MIDAPARLFLLFWMFGRTRGLLGGLVGGFIGALVVTGLARTARNGELAALYSPGELASAALVVAAVATLPALVAPYATGAASVGWLAGAVFAALAAPETGQTVYLLPLVLHVLAAAAVLSVARRRAAAL